MSRAYRREAIPAVPLCFISDLWGERVVSRRAVRLIYADWIPQQSQTGFRLDRDRVSRIERQPVTGFAHRCIANRIHALSPTDRLHEAAQLC